MAVTILDGVSKNPNYLLTLRFAECLSSFLNKLEEFTTSHQVHDQTNMSFILECFMKPNYTGMIQLFKNLYLSLESDKVIILHFLFAHDLTSVPLATLSMLDPFDSREGALTYCVLDFIFIFDVCILCLHYNQM